MSRVSRPYGSWAASFPRVSGDEPTAPGTGGSQGKFSPRERG